MPNYFDVYYSLLLLLTLIIITTKWVQKVILTRPTMK